MSERLWARTWAPKMASSLKVFQWNVLADGLAQHGDFVRVCGAIRRFSLIWFFADPVRPALNAHCLQVPQQALEWSFRQHLVLEEILKPQADIVCLQEVNTYGTLWAQVVM